MYSRSWFVFSCSLLLLVAHVGEVGTAKADTLMSLITPNLPGNTQFDGWGNFGSYASLQDEGNNFLYPMFPGSGSWLAPMESLVFGSDDAVLTKVSNGTGGGPYPTTQSLYFGGISAIPNTDGGTLAVIDATPVANLKNVVFQIQIGPAFGFDFFDGALPILNYNGGSQKLENTQYEVLQEFDTGETVEGEPVYITTYLMSWDLSGITDPIDNFAIQFTAVQHAQVYAMQLDQSDTITVPEPMGFSLIGAALMCLARFRRASSDTTPL